MKLKSHLECWITLTYFRGEGCWCDILKARCAYWGREGFTLENWLPDTYIFPKQKRGNQRYCFSLSFSCFLDHPRFHHLKGSSEHLLHAVYEKKETQGNCFLFNNSLCDQRLDINSNKNPTETIFQKLKISTHAISKLYQRNLFPLR